MMVSTTGESLALSPGFVVRSLNTNPHSKYSRSCYTTSVLAMRISIYLPNQEPQDFKNLNVVYIACSGLVHREKLKKFDYTYIYRRALGKRQENFIIVLMVIVISYVYVCIMQ